MLFGHLNKIPTWLQRFQKLIVDFDVIFLIMGATTLLFSPIQFVVDMHVVFILNSHEEIVLKEIVVVIFVGARLAFFKILLDFIFFQKTMALNSFSEYVKNV